MNRLNLFTFGVFLYSGIVCATFKKDNLNSISTNAKVSTNSSKSHISELKGIMSNFPKMVSLTSAGPSEKSFSK